MKRVKSTCLAALACCLFATTSAAQQRKPDPLIDLIKKDPVRARRLLELRRRELQRLEQMLGPAQGPQAGDRPAAGTEKKATVPVDEDEFLRLGTESGQGGADWQGYERSRTKDLIRSFIPPLLRPAVVGHAFVLPHNTWMISLSGRLAQIRGEDFFDDHDRNREVFRDFKVQRQLLDLDLDYGFDLGRKYLHDFTLRLNVPYRAAQTEGFIHPNGFPLVDLFTEAEVAELGDVGLFLKKKFVDQSKWPIQIAGAVGVRFPTGSNDEKFVDSGRIKMRRPDPTMGMGQPGRPPLNMPLPLAMLRKMPRATTPFIFNGPLGRTHPDGGKLNNPGVFWRFHDDGRLPAVLQPGTGNFSLFAGLFFTRVNQQDFLLGRSAFHWGVTHDFRFEKDGIDPGDKTTLFASFVKPLVKDYLSADLSFITFYQHEDRYSGTIFGPTPTDAMGNPVANWDVATHATFREERREPFSKGWTSYLAPSLIFSPDPQIRITASLLLRVVEPELGPAPHYIARLALEVTF